MQPPPTPPPEVPSTSTLSTRSRKSSKSAKKTMKALPQLVNSDNQVPMFARSSAVADKFLLKFQKNQLEKEIELEQSPKSHKAAEIVTYSVTDTVITNDFQHHHASEQHHQSQAQLQVQQSEHETSSKLLLFTPQVRTIRVSQHREPSEKENEPQKPDVKEETHVAVTPLSFKHGLSNSNLPANDPLSLDGHPHHSHHVQHGHAHSAAHRLATKPIVHGNSPKRNPKRIKVRLSTNGNLSNFNLASMNQDMLTGLNEMESQMSGFRVITEQEFEIMTDIKDKYKMMLDYLQTNEKVLHDSQSTYQKKVAEIQKYWSNMAKVCEEQSTRLCQVLEEEYETAKEEIATESQTIYNHLSKLYSDMKELKQNVSKPVRSMHELRERSSVTQRLSQINLGTLTEFIKKNELNQNDADDKLRIIESMEFDIKVNWNQIESVIKNRNNDVDVRNIFKAVDLNGNPIGIRHRSNMHTSKNSSQKSQFSQDASNELSSSESTTDQINQLSNTKSKQTLGKPQESSTVLTRKNKSKKIEADTETETENRLNNINNTPQVERNEVQPEIPPTTSITTTNNKEEEQSRNQGIANAEISEKQQHVESIGKVEAQDYHHTRASLSFDEELKEEFLKQWQNDQPTATSSNLDTSSVSEFDPKMMLQDNDTSKSPNTKDENMIDSTFFCFTRDGDIHECRIQIDISNNGFAMLGNKWNLTENEPEIELNDEQNVTNGNDDQSTEFFNSKLLHRTKYPAVCLDNSTKKLYRFGGVLEGTQLGLSESFDTETRLWNSVSESDSMIYQQLPVPRQEGLALQLNRDSIIVCGGAAKLPKYSDLNENSLILSGARTSAQSEWHFYDICDEFHVSKNQWNSTLTGRNEDSMYDSAIASMNEARYAFSGVVIPGEYKAIITGGNGPNGRTKTSEMYDRVSNTWKYLNNMPNIKARHGSCWYDSMNTMIVVGGDGKSKSKLCFAYDLEKNQWFGDMPKLNKDHDRPVVKCYEDKSIVIVFGHNAKLNSFELLDGRIANSKWQITNVRNHPVNIDFRAGMAVV